MIKMFGKQVNHEFGINRKGFLNSPPGPQKNLCRKQICPIVLATRTRASKTAPKNTLLCVVVLMLLYFPSQASWTPRGHALHHHHCQFIHHFFSLVLMIVCLHVLCFGNLANVSGKNYYLWSHATYSITKTKLAPPIHVSCERVLPLDSVCVYVPS